MSRQDIAVSVTSSPGDLHMRRREFEAMMDEKNVHPEDELTFVTQARDRGEDSRTRVEFGVIEVREQVDVSPTNHHARIVFIR
jgi:hypothetical protein